MASEKRFGFEWKRYSDMHHYKEAYREQFLNWVWPLGPSFFKGKTVLDAGCGMGRNSYWCVQWGAKSVVAFDFDERTIGAARNNLAHFPRAEIKLQSIYDLPWRDCFDFVFSIGVIHHLEEPEKALEQLKKALKPGGEILIWVYGSSGFEFLLKYLNLVRRYVTSKMPLSLLYILTFGLSVPLYVYLKLINPKRLYFKQIKRYRLGHLHLIVFDQLIPEVANYYTKEEAISLLAGFDDVTITVPPNENGWIVRGKKPTI